ncbi:hypothetical protein GGR32_001665 [Mesonia hippocampi]|uniref:Secreted protein (Por secretion system target) n=1 Tax=Mesonia hippocampi TaxID=1628250 RepID=A0A840EX11_9FLAO|nr:M43 family zinc metalloprotease [Mesonia hippocampi]MBB4119367.1 hypothetical protein [Mesonia hippocampi]
MKFITTTFFTLLLSSYALIAQDSKVIEPCATHISNEYQAQTNRFENWLSPKVTQLKKMRLLGKVQQTGVLHTIPVVVHVIHNGDPINTNGDADNENISYNQVLSQINVLNQDFRRIAGTPGAEVSNYQLGVDTQIEFALAKRDPNGLPTNGVNRINMCEESWGKYQTLNSVIPYIDSNIKEQTIWDPTKYLNIWVIKFGGSFHNGLFGYAQFPEASTLSGIPAETGANPELTDGVVVGYQNFGDITQDDGSFSLYYLTEMGRTTTHEVGHYLGLRHIWGDGDCSYDDYVADTPDQEDSSSQADNNCTISFTCQTDDMIENYMDYSAELCQNTFTQGQKDRMLTVLQNSPRRIELATSDALTPVAMPLEARLVVDFCNAKTLTCSNSGVINTEIINLGENNITSAVISYQLNNGTADTTTWTGNLSQFSSENVVINTGTLQDGINTIDVEIITVNNQTDNEQLNNTVSGELSHSFTDPASILSYDETVFNLSLTTDQYAYETSWDLRDANGEVIESGDNLTQFQTYTETFTLAPNSCYTFTVYDSYGDGFNGDMEFSTAGGAILMQGSFSGAYANSVTFKTGSLSVTDNKMTEALSIYPNPTKGSLNVLGENMPFNKYIIYNTLGQRVASKEFSLTTEQSIDVYNLQKGIYFIELYMENMNKKVIRFIKD